MGDGERGRRKGSREGGRREGSEIEAPRIGVPREAVCVWFICVSLGLLLRKEERLSFHSLHPSGAHLFSLSCHKVETVSPAPLRGTWESE